METALVADIGGTNARFALLRAGTQGPVTELRTGDFPDLGAAFDHVLAALEVTAVDAVAACAAGAPRDGVIRLTNCPWEVSVVALRDATGTAQPILVNDFTAVAAALADLARGDLESVGNGVATPGEACAVLGPGTGLGVSARLAGGALVTGQGGHVDLPSAGGDEDRILARLRERFGHVSAERVLSGPGLANLHAAMHPDDESAAASRPEAVTEAARGGDTRALVSISQFCAFLGAVAGNLALTVGARGGVFLAGGIVPGWGTLFDGNAFRARFEDKGRYREYLRPVPTYIITTPHPALRGLARLLAGN